MLLKSCRKVLTQDGKRTILDDVDIFIEDGKITGIGKGLKKSGEVVDCSDKVVMPGLCNLHTHVGMALMRGFGDDMHLQEWLSEKIWPTETKLDAGLVKTASTFGMLEMIRTGTTCFHDMYFFGDAVLGAVKESGMRGVFSQAVLDFPTMEFKTPDEALKLASGLMEKHKNDEFAMANVGTHAPYTCSDETLLKGKELADNHKSSLHIHVSETRKEVADSLKNRNLRPVDHLDKIGFLGDNVVAAHCGWLTKGEVKTLGKRGVSVAHCPVSNMKLATGGVAPLPEMFSDGVNVGLGTDSVASNNNLDMFEEMKLAALIHKASRWDATIVDAQKVLDMATRNGFQALGVKSGSIEPGMNADILLLDAKDTSMTPMHNPVSNVVYSTLGHAVDSTIVGGKFLMRDKKILTLDEENVREDLLDAAGKIIS